MDSPVLEREYAARGFCAVAGVDEVGRGPLAGPVVCAAVILPLDEALRVPDSPASGEWDSTVETLDRLRGELNEYVAELHRVFPNGLSAYTCFARLFRKKNILPEGSLNVDCLNESRADFETL